MEKRKEEWDPRYSCEVCEYHGRDADKLRRHQGTKRHKDRVESEKQFNRLDRTHDSPGTYMEKRCRQCLQNSRYNGFRLHRYKAQTEKEKKLAREQREHREATAVTWSKTRRGRHLYITRRIPRKPNPTETCVLIASRRIERVGPNKPHRPKQRVP